MTALKLRTAPKLRLLSQEPTGADGPNLYWALRNNPLRYVDPTGLSAEDVRRIKGGFNTFVDSLDRTGQRFPGRGRVVGTVSGMATNIAAAGPLTWNAFLADKFGSTANVKFQACVPQADSFKAKLDEMQRSGFLSSDFTFERSTSHLGGVFEHNFVTGTSEADNLILTLDPWRGVIDSRPLHP